MNKGRINAPFCQPLHSFLTSSTNKPQYRRTAAARSPQLGRVPLSDKNRFGGFALITG
jgi:hypothetical protein